MTAIQAQLPPPGYGLQLRTNVNGGAIFRFRRLVQGLPVLDHEIIRRWDERKGMLYQRVQVAHDRWQPLADFQLTDAQALNRALLVGPKFPHEEPTADGNWFAYRAWRPSSNGLAPTWVVRLGSPLPFERLEVRLDGVTGEILARENGVRRALAHVFERSPGAERDMETLLEVTLDPAPAGRVLQSAEFEIRACCLEENCEAGSGPQTTTMPMGGFNITMPLCDERPEARSDDEGNFIYEPRLIGWRPEAPGLMVRPLPADVTHPDAPHHDSFAEAQGYYHAHKYLGFLRENGLPDLTLGDGRRGFAVSVNYMVPAIPFNGQEGIQALAAAGCLNMAAQEITCFMPMDNSVFIPSVGQASEETPIPFERAFDSVLMFQGAAGSFVYDADVLYHELTHAAIHATSQLGGAYRGPWGTHVTPGSLHEGFADYLSMLITGDPVMGAFVGGAEGIRNNGQGRGCPNDLIGEVHHDGMPWASQLWVFRQGLESESAVAAFDEAVVTGLAAIPTREAGYNDASAAIAAELEHLLDSESAQQFSDHMLAAGLTRCDREIDLLTVVEHEGQRPELISHSPEDVHLAGASAMGLREGEHTPTFFQGRIEMPKGTTAVELRFATQASGGFMGGNSAAPELTAVVRDGAPVEFSYTDGRVAWNDDARLYPITMQGNDGVLRVEGLDTACGGPLYVSLGTKTGGSRLADFHVNVEYDDDLAEQCDPPEPVEPGPEVGNPPVPEGCACEGSAGISALWLLPLLLVLRRRKLLLI